jgi:hypothetical protein
MENTTKINKRVESTKKYVDALSANHSKLNIIRVDLAYTKDENKKVAVSLDEANDDFNRMMNNRRTKPSIFKDQVGYICKKEYTPDKGIHFHVLFLYDGQKVQKDKFKADQIGEYWNKEITKNKGTYHNCNRNKYKQSGIGMINHQDTEKRKILDENVISYLCKDDHQDIEPIKTNKNNRAFIRGIVPKSKGKVGRPRG